MFGHPFGHLADMFADDRGIAGEKIEPVREGPARQVINLMDALRASIDAEKKKASAPSTAAC
jgi:non-homologous end joining protein Ku